MKSEMLLLCVLITFAIIGGHLRRKSKEREARLKLIEKALDKPGLDDATRRELAEFLRKGEPLGRRIARMLTSGGVGLRYLLLLAGWVGIFVGIGIVAFGGPRDKENGMITLFVSFGVLTVPFALQEFERRRVA